jgi:rubrerythrin
MSQTQVMDGKTFAVEVIRRSFTFAQQFTQAIYGDVPRPLKGEALISLLRTNMWREYMLGVQGPARLMTSLPAEAVDLKRLLASQIIDEMRHSQIFPARVQELGGDGEFFHYQPAEEDWKLYYATVKFEDPAELVTSLNRSGEVVLQQTFMRITKRSRGKPGIVDDETAEIIEREMLYDEDETVLPLVDEKTARELQENVIPDEGRHIKIGRLILERYATTPEIQERCRQVQERKFAALNAAHGHTVAEAKRLTLS